MVIENISPWAN